MGPSDRGQGGRGSVPGSGEIVQGQFVCENITPINLPEPTGVKTNHLQKCGSLSPAKLTTGLI